MEYIFIILFILIFLIKNYSFNEGIPTCNNFVVNVYLYLSIAILLTGIFMYYIKNIGINNKLYIGSIIMSFILIILLSLRPIYYKKGTVFNHLLWILFILSIAVLLTPISEKHIIPNLIKVSIIFMLMTLLSIYNKKLIDTYSSYIFSVLFISLITIIVSELLFLIFYPDKYNINIMSVIVVILFSGFIVYDTNRIYKYSDNCINKPNYPKVSLDLFLDLLNIFVR